MRYLIITICLLALGLALQTCSEDFLDTKPIAMETEESFYSSMNAVEPAVIACYSQLSRMRTVDFNFVVGMGSVASDDCEAGGDGSAGDTPDMQALDRLTYTPRDITTIERIWGFFYKGVYFCNVALEKLPEIAVTDPDANVELINERVAEVKFLRALYYFLLSQAYGGVCNVTTPLAPDELSQPRVTIKEIYEDIIEKDLKEAIPNLPVRSALDNAGRASRGAAQALLAKMLLYESSYALNYPGDARFGNMTQRWDEALQYAEEVINSGEYKLLGIDGETFDTYWSPQTNAFRYIFSVDGDNCQENIFEIQNTNDDWIWVQSTGNALTMFCTSRRIMLPSGAPEQLGW
ncbi:MAG: RagB/SusD family nutrient uptake outer membrane protein [Bacteroidales bacterium]|nr:MAG: RagB/SusD family nutrient uptake outer membrane protein [Bacteroidales bacterium]